MSSYPESLLHLAEITPLPIPVGALTTELINRLCGDRITISAKLANHHVEQLFWQVEGCVILKASAAYLARGIEGKEMTAALDWIMDFKNSFTDEARRWQGPLAAVYHLPARYKCALLPFEACENFLRERI